MIYKVGDLVQLNFNDGWRSSVYIKDAHSGSDLICESPYKGIVMEEGVSDAGYWMIKVKFFNRGGIFEFLREDPKLTLISSS
jgi:hypothetical protein